MKSSNAYFALAVILSLGLSSYQRADAAEAYDDEGTLISLTAPAMRIISLAPSLTEILYAAGAGSKVVGVVEFSDYPPEARSLPVVGRYDALDLETLLALQPDLVIAWRSGNPRAAINRLRELGLTVYVAEPQELDTVASHLDRLGTLAGTGTRLPQPAQVFDDSFRISGHATPGVNQSERFTRSGTGRSSRPVGKS